MRDDFCVFILSHGRSDNVITLETLNKLNYSGKWYIIIDNEDVDADKYYNNFGKDKIYKFDKLKISKTFDEMDNFDNRKTIVYARNYCFQLAKKLKVKYFMELDDDYSSIDYRFDLDGTFRHLPIKNGTNGHFENIINTMIKFFEGNKKIACIAMAQNGEYVTGSSSHLGSNITVKRKAMNTLLCSIERQFKFIGRINEDVNTYVSLGQLGYMFFTFGLVSIEQKHTQSNPGGMTDIYIENGTYVKSFYTVMLSPSSVKIYLMGTKEKRLHHKITVNNTYPCIIREEHKKLF